MPGEVQSAVDNGIGNTRFPTAGNNVLTFSVRMIYDGAALSRLVIVRESREEEKRRTPWANLGWKFETLGRNSTSVGDVGVNP